MMVQVAVWSSQASFESRMGKGTWHAHAELRFLASIAACRPCHMSLQGDGETKRREERRRKVQTPTSTLFIVNFDIDNTREADLQKHFAPYGKLNRVQIKRNYGFVQYTDLEDAIAAREATNLSRLLGDMLYKLVLKRVAICLDAYKCAMVLLWQLFCLLCFVTRRLPMTLYKQQGTCRCACCSNPAKPCECILLQPLRW